MNIIMNINKKNSKNNYKLGIICPSDFIDGVRGGAAGFISNLITDFKSNKIIIFGMSTSKIKPWKYIKVNDEVKFVPICKLKYPSKIPMRLKVLFYFFVYRNAILNSGIDLLYIHSPECCLPFLCFKKIPVVYHQHGSANPVELSKYKFARLKFVQRIFDLILKLIYKNADWIISIDNFCYEDAVKNGARFTTSLFRNAINIKNYNPNISTRRLMRNKYEISEKRNVILFVGRIAKTKGVLRLLKCIPILKENKLNFHIYFAGDGSYLEDAKNFVKKKTFDEYVTFLGTIQHRKLSDYYNMADVMVLPSDMEGVPMVVLESIACGTPVVASNVGGIPDIVINGRNGFVVNDLSADNLSKKIIDALKMKQNRNSISLTVKEYSSENFIINFEKIVNKLCY